MVYRCAYCGTVAATDYASVKIAILLGMRECSNPNCHKPLIVKEDFVRTRN